MKNKKPSRYPLSDHYDGNQFFNPGRHIKKSLHDVVKFMMGSFNTAKWPEHIVNDTKPILAQSLTLDECYITYINHATHLIQFHNLNVLTDPIFSERASPFSFLGPKRVRDPGIPLTQLPGIHIVVISHNHYDHMDLPSLIQLNQLYHPLFIVPLGNAHYLKKENIESVLELDWWQTHTLNGAQSITLLPALHWSKRGILDENKALWGSFWIQSEDLKIYFAGDTGYGELFKTIQQKIGTPDASILPIGSYAPRWFMQAQHMDPNEAVLASLDLKCQLNIATHHRTFRLSYEDYDEPRLRLRTSMELHDVDENTFLTPENGETVIIQKKR